MISHRCTPQKLYDGIYNDGIPIVFDYHHHAAPGGQSKKKALETRYPRRGYQTSCTLQGHPLTSVPIIQRLSHQAHSDLVITH